MNNMREILFKAKRKDNGKWVEGYLMDENYINVPFDDYDACGRFDDPIEIDPDTICQFTGLTDKNDKKIWENDIVDTFEESSKSFLRNVIKFEEGCFKVFAKCYLPMHLDNYTKSDFEVIENIFDNSELLGVE